MPPWRRGRAARERAAAPGGHGQRNAATSPRDVCRGRIVREVDAWLRRTGRLDAGPERTIRTAPRHRRCGCATTQRQSREATAGLKRRAFATQTDAGTIRSPRLLRMETACVTRCRLCRGRGVGAGLSAHASRARWHRRRWRFRDACAPRAQERAPARTRPALQLTALDVDRPVSSRRETIER